MHIPILYKQIYFVWLLKSLFAFCSLNRLHKVYFSVANLLEYTSAFTNFYFPIKKNFSSHVHDALICMPQQMTAHHHITPLKLGFLSFDALKCILCIMWKSNKLARVFDAAAPTKPIVPILLCLPHILTIERDLPYSPLCGLLLHFAVLVCGCCQST